jgi:calcium-dependent protein kinase
MRTLQEHPNTVKLVDVFDQHDQYVLVMELCSGGELFDQIISKVCGHRHARG